MVWVKYGKIKEEQSGFFYWCCVGVKSWIPMSDDRKIQQLRFRYCFFFVK